MNEHLGRPRTRATWRWPSLLVGLALLAGPLWGQSGPEPRGPYLQMGTSTSIVVKWRTTDPSDSRVRYGAAPGQLDNIVDDPLVDTDHEVALSGLSPDTTYYYSYGSTTAAIAGDDNEHYFRTAPFPGSQHPVRVWAIGDSGLANDNIQTVRDAYATYTGSLGTDVWLMLGDNAYTGGTDAQYQAAVFGIFPEMLRTTVLWPTFGNHERPASSSPTESGPYYDIFTLPRAGEAGGIASGTEAYYSFDYANVHFICLNSEDAGSSPGSAMLTWLEQDLMNASADWKIAFFHHAPYSHGSHDSDNPSDSGGRLFSMRENVVPILEAGGVDLVLTGHSHGYERTFLLNGHYDVSSTLTSEMILDGGDGRVQGDGAYEQTGLPGQEGTVYVVAGSSASVHNGSYDHPAMFTSLQTLGSLVIDVDGEQLDLAFLDDQGTVQDQFTLLKATGSIQPPAPPTNLHVVANP